MPYILLLDMPSVSPAWRLLSTSACLVPQTCQDFKFRKGCKIQYYGTDTLSSDLVAFTQQLGGPTSSYFKSHPCLNRYEFAFSASLGKHLRQQAQSKLWEKVMGQGVKIVLPLFQALPISVKWLNVDYIGGWQEENEWTVPRDRG